MSVTQVDRRQIHAERDDEALREVESRQAAWLESELALARLFCRIDRGAAFLFAGAASVSELAARKGYDGFRAHDLMLAGYALAGEPALEDALRGGEIGLPAVIALGPLYRTPELVEPEDRWVEWARTLRLKDLRRRVRARVEADRQQVERVHLYTAHVSPETRDALTHCREVASRKAGRLLTRGQTLTVLAAHYLDRHDPLAAKTPRPRRMPPTATRLRHRGVPAAVARRIEERSGGLCEFGGCDRPGVELCHIRPHRHGSAREVGDLVRGCRRHHKAYDAGWIRFLGWTDDRLPSFLVTETNEILKPKPRPEPDAPPERPEWLLRALGTGSNGGKSGRENPPRAPPAN